MKDKINKKLWGNTVAEAMYKDGGMRKQMTYSLILIGLFTAFCATLDTVYWIYNKNRRNFDKE